MALDFNNISLEESKKLLKEQYGLTGELASLPGELDNNFKVSTSKKDYILKISRPGTDINQVNFQCEILKYLNSCNANIVVPEFIENLQNEYIGSHINFSNETVYVRLLTWIDGILWSSLSRYSEELLYSLGAEAGKITNALQGFKSEYAQRNFDWDINNTYWTKEYQNSFQDEKRDLILHFYTGFETIYPKLQKCRKSIVHNDVNDYNILVSATDSSKVKAVIDYGDSIFTATINDLAVCLTYAVMDKTDPLEAVVPVIQGYNSEFSLLEEELEILYWLIGARLVISLTKSTVNLQKEPDNPYLTISEKPAWDLIKKWKNIDPVIATAFFRKASSFPAHRTWENFITHAKSNKYSIKNLISIDQETRVYPIELDISSATIPEFSVFKDPQKITERVKQIWNENNHPLIVGGYNEVRPEFISRKYEKETNNGSIWKNLFLGTQFWLFKDCEVKSLLPGKVIFAKNKTVFLEHIIDGNLTFYSIYRNLKLIERLRQGQQLKKEAVLGNFLIGEQQDYKPFFFQISLLNPVKIAPGTTCTYQEGKIFTEIYPSPGFLLKEISPSVKNIQDDDNLIAFRKAHLGKSLSLSYRKPLKMVRGDGIYLIDHTGRRYMDMVNNVAHVGHEHPEVVKTGQQQMAMLNTNSRYLHSKMNEFAENLLSTFPEELSVVHFVNSGSEANELAIRMAKAYSGQKDFLAVEVGYHGNSNACIDISSYKFDGKGGAGAPEFTHIVPLPDSFRGKYTDPDCGRKYATHVQNEIKKIQEKGRGPAAFICESIISCGGQIELPGDYLKMAYAYTRKAGGLCIADEVQVGCGRVGSAFWGFQLHNVVPDIVTIGKPIGNGHPLAAVVCTQKVAAAFANGMEYFNTFGGNPVSCAIGNQVLEVIKNENLQENALNTGNYLKQQLRELQQQFPIIADVRGQGLFLGFELTDAHKAPLTSKASYLVNRMKELGVLMSSDGPDNNVLKIKPPMVFKRHHSDEFIEKLSQVMAEDFMRISN